MKWVKYAAYMRGMGTCRTFLENKEFLEEE